MHIVSSIRPDLVRSPASRVGAAAAGLAAVAGAIWIAGPGWPLWVALVAPDLPALAGMSRGLAPKQLHPRAVPWYNATHRFGGGLAVVAAGLVLGQALFTAIGLMWVAHVLIDRAAGYTLRDRDGFVRG